MGCEIWLPVILGMHVCWTLNMRPPKSEDYSPLQNMIIPHILEVKETP